MAITLDQARTLVFEHLTTRLGHPRPVTTGLIAVERAVRDLALANGFDVDWNGAGDHFQGMDSVNVRAALSELETAGVIVWGESAMQPGPPFLQITSFGLQCLQQAQINPHDTNGYLAALAVRVPALDPTARGYVEEALECLRRGCHRACAVMLGGASETVMLQLISSFHHALQEPVRKSRFAKKAMNPISIRQRFDHLRQELGTIRATLPHALDEDLDLKLDGIFVLIRSARNDGGHPNVAAPTRETVQGNLLLFPSYADRAYALMGHLANNPIP